MASLAIKKIVKQQKVITTLNVCSAGVSLYVYILIGENIDRLYIYHFLEHQPDQ